LISLLELPFDDVFIVELCPAGSGVNAGIVLTVSHYASISTVSSWANLRAVKLTQVLLPERLFMMVSP
jgi:hypothetical protein